MLTENEKQVLYKNEYKRLMDQLKNCNVPQSGCSYRQMKCTSTETCKQPKRICVHRGMHNEDGTCLMEHTCKGTCVFTGNIRGY